MYIDGLTTRYRFVRYWLWGWVVYLVEVRLVPRKVFGLSGLSVFAFNF